MSSYAQSRPEERSSSWLLFSGYREAFANVLVCATRAKRLRGNEQLLFERRRGLPYEHGRPIEPRKPLERNTSSWRRRNTG